jgi:hypothetical protein
VALRSWGLVSLRGALIDRRGELVFLFASGVLDWILIDGRLVLP